MEMLLLESFLLVGIFIRFFVQQNSHIILSGIDDTSHTHSIRVDAVQGNIVFADQVSALFRNQSERIVPHRLSENV